MPPLRLKVLSPVDPRRAGTNAIADVRFCAAFAELGHRVEWIVPTLGRPDLVRDLDIWEMHGLPRTFEVRFVRTGRGGGPLDIRRVAPLFIHGLGLLLSHGGPDYVISRDLRLLAPLLLRNRGHIAIPWMHEYRAERWEAWLCRRAHALLATNSAIIADVAHDAPDIRTFITGNPIPQDWIRFAESTTRAEARARLRMTFSQPLIVYTGRIYVGMAEFEYLLTAAAALRNCHFLMTGGRPEALRVVRAEITRRRLENVTLTGLLERPEEARMYQLAADILVSYYSIRDHPFAQHNLPNKLAEYMATGNPVVLADFPAVRDLASPESAVLVPPDEPQSFVDALDALVQDPARARRIGACAQEVVRGCSYERVAAGVAGFLQGV